MELFALYVFAPLGLGVLIEVVQYFFIDGRELHLYDRIADTLSYSFISASAYMVYAGFDLRILAPIAGGYLVSRYLDSGRPFPAYAMLLHDFSHSGQGAGLVLLLTAFQFGA